MGNTGESPRGELIFVQALEDKHFGEVEIYRSQEGLFIMKVCRTVISGDKRHLEQLHLMEELQGIASIIPIIHLRRNEEKGLCIKYERLQIYTEYYNFTLADLIATKREMEEGELWLMLTWMLDIVSKLRRKQIGVSLKLDTIFLTPSGAPCIYHYHLHSCRESITYSELTMQQSIGKILLQLALGMDMKDINEQQLIQQDHLFVKVATKYKILGTIIKRLIVDGAMQEEIREEVGKLREEELIHVATQVKLLKFKYHLPQNPQFLNIPTLSKTPSSASGKANNKENNIPHHTIGKSINKKLPNNISNQSVSQFDHSKKILPTQQSNIKQRRMTEISSVFNNSSNKKQSTLKQDIFKTKEETSKMLGELDRKKEEYRLQREKFEMRKEQLMRATGKENERERGSQMRKSERRKDSQGRKLMQQNRNGRYR